MLDPLATVDDLTARNIAVPDGLDPSVLLDSASTSVRDAAGCAISLATSTVVLVVQDYDDFDLPGPVASVASLSVGGVALTGWTVVSDTVTMPYGWTRTLPAAVTVTFTHGLAVVPADIVDLVCGMVGIATNRGYGQPGNLTGFRLGDYSESFSRPDGTDSPSPMALPRTVIDRLQARFGKSAAAVRTMSTVSAGYCGPDVSDSVSTAMIDAEVGAYIGGLFA